MLLTFGITALSLLGSTLATSPSVGRALAKLDATNTITLAVGPSGSSGQKFEYTTDNGTTWKTWTTKTGSREMGPLSSIGYRVKGTNSTAVIHQNTIAPYSNVEGYSPYYWASYTNGPDPYLVGLYSNNVYIYTDFSKPALSNVSDAWVPTPIPGMVKMSNDGECPVKPFNATVFYIAASRLAPKMVQSPNGGLMQFDIADVRTLANVSFSFGAVIQAGVPNPFLMWYNDATKGPQITAHMELYGGFCIDDD